MTFRGTWPVRFFVRYASILYCWGLPIFLFWSLLQFEESWLVYAVCSVLFCACVILWWNAFFEKSFGVLRITEEGIYWKCPLRKTKFLSIEKCKQIGIEYENENQLYARPIIYFSSFNYPEDKRNKIHKLKRTEGFIQYMYSDEIGDYIVENFPKTVTYPLISYRNKDQSKKLGVFKHWFRH